MFLCGRLRLTPTHPPVSGVSVTNLTYAVMLSRRAPIGVILMSEQSAIPRVILMSELASEEGSGRGVGRVPEQPGNPSPDDLVRILRYSGRRAVRSDRPPRVSGGRETTSRDE